MVDLVRTKREFGTSLDKGTGSSFADGETRADSPKTITVKCGEEKVVSLFPVSDRLLPRFLCRRRFSHLGFLRRLCQGPMMRGRQCAQ